MIICFFDLFCSESHPAAEHITHHYYLLQAGLLQTHGIWLQQQADCITGVTDSNTYSTNTEQLENFLLGMNKQRGHQLLGLAWLNTQKWSSRRHGQKPLTQRSFSDMMFSVAGVIYLPVRRIIRLSDWCHLILSTVISHLVSEVIWLHPLKSSGHSN